MSRLAAVIRARIDIYIFIVERRALSTMNNIPQVEFIKMTWAQKPKIIESHKKD